MGRIVAVCAVSISWVAALLGADIDGVVVIKRKLTKRAVTTQATLYHRGATPEPSAAPPEDPLVFERTRVAIYLEGEIPSPPTTAIMEQKNRRFLPDTLVIPAGSSVSFPNLDPIFHNVFSLSKPKTFDLGNYAKNQTRVVTFTKPGIVFVHCHLHPNMAASIVVTPNQWATKPDGEGRFRLSGVPEGKYTVVAWHKTAGFFRKQIQVTANGVAPIEFYIPLEAASLASQSH